MSGTQSGTGRAVEASKEDAALLRELRESGLPRVRKLFQSEDEIARDALVAIATDEAAPHAARVTASKTILEYGYGKPTTLQSGNRAGAATADGGRGFQVVIKQFFPTDGDNMTVVDVESVVETIDE